MRSLRALVPTPLRLIAAHLLPYPSRLSSPKVSKVSSLVIREGVRLSVYWLDISAGISSPSGGAGPAASLVAFDDEVMRFDCLGEHQGHMHLNMKQSRGFPGDVARLYFREQSIVEQVERSCFELEKNLDYALRTNFARKVRRVRLDTEEIERASSFMRDTMLMLIAKHESNSKVKT